MARTKKKKILLLGNGMNLYVANNKSNSEIIDDLFKKYKRQFNKVDREKILRELPYTLAATLSLSIGNKTKKEKIESTKLLEIDKYKENDVLKKLIQMTFDEIFTTNYTYEVETTIKPSFDQNDKSHIMTSYRDKNGKTRKESKYFLQTWNQISNDVETYNIWHIHGELRNPNSVVYGITDYNGLICKVNNYINKQYQSGNTVLLNNNSWIDHFLNGDVYIVGLGLSFYEYDLWQLLFKKMSVEGHGKTVFYEPESDKEWAKHRALELAKVKVYNLGHKQIQNEEFDYHKFYDDVIIDLTKKQGLQYRNEKYQKHI